MYRAKSTVMSYRKLEVWRLAQRLTTEIHKMTLDLLPRHEMYEEGGQIRRSIKSVRSNIVEGYGRRRYKQDFIRFLTYAQASCDETMDHLEILRETGSLTDNGLFEIIQEHVDELGRKLNNFTQSVERDHRSFREAESLYGSEISAERESSIQDRESSIENRVSSIQHPASDEETPH
jgi:four helix bundle protein